MHPQYHKKSPLNWVYSSQFGLRTHRFFRNLKYDCQPVQWFEHRSQAQWPVKHPMHHWSDWTQKHDWLIR